LRRKAFFNYLFLFLVIGLFAALSFYLARHRLPGGAPPTPEAPGHTEAELSISRFHHTASREGKTQWSLEADSAEYFADNSRVRLRNVSVTFFPASGQPKTRLSSEAGILQLDTHNMEVSGNVVVENSRYRLETEILHYHEDSNIISADKPVRITSAAAELKADEMRFNLKSGRLVCLGHVKGTLAGAKMPDLFE
jgi:LPS export ABC transporter protein LptC